MNPIDYTDHRRARLDVEFHFAAAHRLPRYDGPCFRMHGHNYQLTVAIEGDVDPHTGMVADFGRIQEVVRAHVLSRADHQVLNDVLENPTAENIARWAYESLQAHLPGMFEVRLQEVPGCCVTYRGPLAR